MGKKPAHKVLFLGDSLLGLHISFGWGQEVGANTFSPCIDSDIISPLENQPHGGRSSMAEHLTVDQDVAGSTPVAHPRKRPA